MHPKSEYHPRKNGDDESLQQCTVGGKERRMGGGEGRGGCCLPLKLLFFLFFGASAVCLSFSPLPVSSPPLCCFPSHQPSLFLPPSPSCLSPTPRGLIYGCGAPETGMTTHAFLSFVSSLACWLALWLTACTWCVFALYSCHAVSVLPQSKNVPLFLFVLFVVVKQRVSPATAVNTQRTSLKRKIFILVPTYRCV